MCHVLNKHYRSITVVLLLHPMPKTTQFFYYTANVLAKKQFKKCNNNDVDKKNIASSSSQCSSYILVNFPTSEFACFACLEIAQATFIARYIHSAACFSSCAFIALNKTNDPSSIINKPPAYVVDSLTCKRTLLSPSEC